MRTVLGCCGRCEHEPCERRPRRGMTFVSFGGRIDDSGRPAAGTSWQRADSRAVRVSRIRLSLPWSTVLRDADERVR